MQIQERFLFKYIHPCCRNYIWIQFFQCYLYFDMESWSFWCYVLKSGRNLITFLHRCFLTKENRYLCWHLVISSKFERKILITIKKCKLIIFKNVNIQHYKNKTCRASVKLEVEIDLGCPNDPISFFRLFMLLFSVLHTFFLCLPSTLWSIPFSLPVL